MFANRYTAFIDTCVLAGALKRNLILHLADAGLFRPRWSSVVLSELERTLPRTMRPGDGQDARIKKLLGAMASAFPEAAISDFAELPSSVMAALPDRGDAHVLAAARQVGANVIVTDNLKHFPATVMAEFRLEVRSADDFIADAIDLHREKAIAAIQTMRRAFQRPDMTGADLLTRLEAVGLVHAAAELSNAEHLI